MMDIHELRQFESVYKPSKEVAFCWLRKQYVQLSTEENHTEIVDHANNSLRIWQAAKAQAVPEQDQQVWATSNLTWKDIAFRALTCKVLKSTENWVHVKNIACVGSTTASLICKKLGVDPDGTKFELIEAQEPAND